MEADLVRVLLLKALKYRKSGAEYVAFLDDLLWRVVAGDAEAVLTLARLCGWQTEPEPGQAQAVVVRKV